MFGLIFLLNQVGILSDEDLTSIGGSSTGSTSSGGYGSSNGDILTACTEVRDLVLQHKSVYYGEYGSDIEEVYNAAITKGTSIVCATYVSLVLYHAGVVEPEEINKYSFHSVSELKNFFTNTGWTQVSNSDMQAGDVLLKFEGQRHAMIYAGNSETWDETCCVWYGSNNSSKPTEKTKTRTSTYLSYCEVWRPSSN